MTPRRYTSDDKERPLNGDENAKLRELIDDRQYWKRTRDIAYSVSLWSAGVIAAVLLIRDQVVDVLRLVNRLLGTAP